MVPMVSLAVHRSDVASEHGGLAAMHGSGLVVSGEEVTKQARLRLLRTLAELYVVDRATVKRR